MRAKPNAIPRGATKARRVPGEKKERGISDEPAIVLTQIGVAQLAPRAADDELARWIDLVGLGHGDIC